jgi:hypothetical protein
MKVMFFGNYERGEALLAPTVVAESIFNKFSKLDHSAIYVCYRCGIFRLFGLVLKFKPDIIHFVTLEMFYVVLLPLRFLTKTKFTYTVHGLASYESKHYVKISWYLKIRTYLNEWIVLHLVDYILTLSKRNSRFISFYFNINKKRILL